MRKCLTTALFLAVYCISIAQSDTSLSQRAAVMMKVTGQSDLDKILDYTYPKLFTLVPREQMLGILKETMDNEDFTTTLDSILIEKIYPVFAVGNAKYARINHTQLMMMKFKEKVDTADKEDFGFLMAMMKEQYGPENVRFDVPNNTLRVFMHSVMVAIKDTHAKEWSFINYSPDKDDFMKMLIGQEAMDKLNEYN